MNFDEYFKIISEKVNLRGSNPSDYTEKVKKAAKRVESEHTDDIKKQVKIGMQHAAEFPKETKNNKIDSDYYKELDKLENKLKKKTTKPFKNIVKDIRKIKENSMASGAGSVFGQPQANPTPQFSSDWYASGDARNIFGGDIQGKKSKKSKKIKLRKQPLMPLMRRTMKNENI